MKKNIQRVLGGVIMVGLFFLGTVDFAHAEETAPIWTSNYGSAPINIEKNSVLDITISASGGSNTKITCADCTAIKFTDNGDGTARIYWDTKNPPYEVGGPYPINVSASNKKDPSKITWGVMNFLIVEPSAAALKWTTGLATINANYGSVFDVTISASGGADTKIECQNCTLVTVTDKGNGSARVYWDTSKVPNLVPGSYMIDLLATSKTNPENSIKGALELFVQQPAPAAGAPQWTNAIVSTVPIKKGETSTIKLSATGGSATAFDCPSCQGAVVKDNGDGTAELTWDTNKNPNFTAGEYTVTVRAYVKADPAKVTLGVIKYQLSLPDGEVSTTGTPAVANSITSDYLKGRYPRPEGYDGPLPDCAFSGTCRSTSDLVILLINAAKFLFSIIGVVAFAAFIYGGFMMIFSFGNSEKVSQGKDAMVAAVVGLIVAFGAYMIINFVLDALQVTDGFRGIIDN